MRRPAAASCDVGERGAPNACLWRVGVRGRLAVSYLGVGVVASFRAHPRLNCAASSLGVTGTSTNHANAPKERSADEPAEPFQRARAARHGRVSQGNVRRENEGRGQPNVRGLCRAQPQVGLCRVRVLPYAPRCGHVILSSLVTCLALTVVNAVALFCCCAGTARSSASRALAYTDRWGCISPSCSP